LQFLRISIARVVRATLASLRDRFETFTAVQRSAKTLLFVKMHIHLYWLRRGARSIRRAAETAAT